MPSDVLGANLDIWTDDAEHLVKLVQGFLARFSYKPGWHFDVTRRPEIAAVCVRVAFCTIDSRATQDWYCDDAASAPRIPIAGQFAVPPQLLFSRDPEGMFRHWLRAMIRDMEFHELDEWFRWDGKLPYDPHVDTMPIVARGP